MVMRMDLGLTRLSPLTRHLMNHGEKDILLDLQASGSSTKNWRAATFHYRGMRSFGNVRKA
jgi:hypothetical protein